MTLVHDDGTPYTRAEVANLRSFEPYGEDEPYPEGFEEQYEVVDHADAKLVVMDEHGAPPVKVVKVNDGVRDTESL